VLPLVWFSQGVSRYTDLAAQVRRVCGMADGWQCVDRVNVSYAKCAPVVTHRPSAATDRRFRAACRLRVSCGRAAQNDWIWTPRSATAGRLTRRLLAAGTGRSGPGHGPLMPSQQGCMRQFRACDVPLLSAGMRSWPYWRGSSARQRAVAAPASSSLARRVLARPGWLPRRPRGRAGEGRSCWPASRPSARPNAVPASRSRLSRSRRRSPARPRALARRGRAARAPQATRRDVHVRHADGQTGVDHRAGQPGERPDDGQDHPDARDRGGQ
jgi:hypothetical protein